MPACLSSAAREERGSGSIRTTRSPAPLPASSRRAALCGWRRAQDTRIDLAALTGNAGPRLCGKRRRLKGQSARQLCTAETQKDTVGIPPACRGRRPARGVGSSISLCWLHGAKTWAAAHSLFNRTRRTDRYDRNPFHSGRVGQRPVRNSTENPSSFGEGSSDGLAGKGAPTSPRGLGSFPGRALGRIKSRQTPLGSDPAASRRLRLR